MGSKTSEARDMLLALLADRAEDATLGPSEVARAIAPGEGWREAMPYVHRAVDALVAEEFVALSWKGSAMTSRAGPYRIRRLPSADHR